LGERISVPLKKLLVWHDNPRAAIEMSENEEEAIDILFEVEGKSKMLSLAADVAQFGLNSHKQPIVVRNENMDSYVVFDGNRRISVLKLLAKGDKRVKGIVNHLNFSLDTEIYVYVTDRVEALRLIEIEHSGEQNGKGQIGWDSFQRDYARYNMGKSPEYPRSFKVSQVCDLLYKKDFKKIPYTDLETIFNNHSIKRIFGIINDWDFNNQDKIREVYLKLVKHKPRQPYSRYLVKLNELGSEYEQFKIKLVHEESSDLFTKDGGSGASNSGTDSSSGISNSGANSSLGTINSGADSSSGTSNSGTDSSLGTINSGANSSLGTINSGADSSSGTSNSGTDSSLGTINSGANSSLGTINSGADSSSGTSNSGTDSSLGTINSGADSSSGTSNSGTDSTSGTSNSGTDSTSGTSNSGADSSSGTSNSGGNNSYKSKPTELLNYAKSNLKIDSYVFKTYLDFVVQSKFNTNHGYKIVVPFLYRVLLESAIQKWIEWFREPINTAKFRKDINGLAGGINISNFLNTPTDTSVVSEKKLKEIKSILKAAKNNNTCNFMKNCFSGLPQNKESLFVNDVNSVIHGSMIEIDIEKLKTYDDLVLRYLRAISYSMNNK